MRQGRTNQLTAFLLIIFLCHPLFASSKNVPQPSDASCAAQLNASNNSKQEIFNLISNLIEDRAYPLDRIYSLSSLNLENFVVRSDLNTSANELNFKNVVILYPSFLTGFSYDYPVVMFDQKAVLVRDTSSRNDTWVLAPIESRIEDFSSTHIYYVRGMSGKSFYGPNPVNPNENIKVKFVYQEPGF